MSVSGHLLHPYKFKCASNIDISEMSLKVEPTFEKKSPWLTPWPVFDHQSCILSDNTGQRALTTSQRSRA